VNKQGPSEETLLAVYTHPARAYHGAAGIRGLVCDDFDRAAPRGVGAYKVGGNYAPVWRHAAKAMAMGYQITLHLDSERREFVEEFATSGFLGWRRSGGDGAGGEGEVLVVPESGCAIESVTSESLVVLARREGWVVEKGLVGCSPVPLFYLVVFFGLLC
jgi:branched-chain amino acid aminotransferase